MADRMDKIDMYVPPVAVFLSLLLRLFY